MRPHLLLAFVALHLEAQMATDTLRLRANLVAARSTEELEPAPYAALRQQYFAWIEKRMHGGRSPDEMNLELRKAALFVTVDSEDDRRPGVIEPLRTRQVEHAKDLLAVEAVIHRGVACNWDASILLYDRHTRRRVATVRAVADTRTEPYSLLALDARRQASGELLIGSLWAVSNCTSTWNGQHLRIDRIDGVRHLVLLEKDLHAQLQEDEAVVVGKGSVRFLYNGAVLDGDILSTAIVSHYRISGNQVTRESPVAMTRAGFLIEWLRGNPNALPGFENGIDWGTISRCPGSPETWEIEVRSRKPEARRFFRMEGTQASRLRMATGKASREAACQAGKSSFLSTIVQPLPE